MHQSAPRAHVIAGVPVLLAAPTSAQGPLPTVFWFHGFRADALAHAAELERCAAAGFLAVGVDAVGHGARRDPALGARVATTPGGAMTVMLEQVEETVTELSALVAALVNDHGADPHRLCAVGISMGAFVAYRAIVTGPPFRSVVALLGNPDGMSPRRAQAYDAVRGVALLSITAEFDVSVPPGPTSVFHEELLRRFGASDRHHHHVLRGAGHLTSSAQWDEAMRETMRWLELSRVFGGGRTSGDDV